MGAEVIVVGAGVAGLAAAERLRAAGHDPLVLEAGNRIGGRILTDASAGAVELGAEFVHGARAATWEIIRREGLVTLPFDVTDARPRRFARGRALLPVDWPGAGRVEAYVERGEQYQGPDISLAEWFRQFSPPEDEAAAFARARIARIEASTPDELSAQALARERALNTAGWDNFRLPGGYNQVVEALSRGARVRLAAPVARIDWATGATRVTLAGGESMPARAIVVAVPLSILQQDVIVFDPALPARKDAAVRRLRMGAGAKLALWFDRSFWPSFSYLGADRELPSWWRAAEATALVGMAGGPEAERLSALGEAGAIADALDALSAWFGVDARSGFKRGRLMDWTSERWIRGAYSFTPVGAGDAREALAESLPPLFFAGEATSTNGHVGTVHGAIETGWRAAAELLASLR